MLQAPVICRGRHQVGRVLFDHAKPGMVDVIHNKRCETLGCSKRPSFGTAGSREAEFCSDHAKPGMIDVTHKRCGEPSCFKQPSYGVAGSRKAEFCSDHAKPDMIDVN